MTTENQDFTILAGDTVEVEDTVDDTDGSARDLTDHGAQVTVAQFRGGPTVIQYGDSDSRFQFTDAVNGKLSATLENDDTEKLGSGSENQVYYEIELEKDGTYHTVSTGHITVKPSY